MNVRRFWAVGLLLLIAVLLLLLIDREAAETGLVTRDDLRGDSDETGLLTSAAPVGEDKDGGGPELETRTPTEAPRPRHDSGPVTVKVVGPAGDGLPGVLVGIVPSSLRVSSYGFAGPPSKSEIRISDANGEVVFAHAPYDGSRAALLFRTDPRVPNARRSYAHARADRGPPAKPILGPTLIYRVAAGLWLEVELVDAETSSAVRHASAQVMAAHAFEAGTAGTGPRYLVLLPTDAPATLTLKVDAPRGAVAWESSSWSVQVSPYARRLVARYPLRRELDVSVSVLEPDRFPMLAPRLHSLRVAGRFRSTDGVVADAYGRLRLTGLPFLPGEIVSLSANRPHGDMTGNVKAVTPDVPARGLHLEIVVPPEPESGMAIGIGGGAGGSFRGRGGRRSLSTTGGGSKPPKGSVVVRVLRRSGKPAVAAKVTMAGRNAHTDASGRAHFSRVPPGTYAVRVRQVGLLPLQGKVTVKGEEAGRCVLREGGVGRLEVRVEDEEGRPLPYATLQVTTGSRHPWVDLDGDVQRVDPFTDHAGGRVLNGVEPCSVRIKASWGSRSGSLSLMVKEGGVHPVRIVLRRPKAP